MLEFPCEAHPEKGYRYGRKDIVMGEWPKPRGAGARERAHSPYQKFMSGGDCLMAAAATAI